MKKYILFMAVSLFALQGCFLAPMIDSVKKAGLTENDRKALLPQSIKKFQEALHWGSPLDALAFAEEEHREEIAKQLDEVGENEKIVESKIRSMNFSDSGYSADVEIMVRSYKVPVYIVGDNLEKQHWKFSLSGGWKIASREVVTTSNVHKPGRL